ncbi:MAG: helix-turn-helix domain-containing protein [Sphingosinicella sp.]|uniref:helix-turn-helix domain-containing protein n=1 Tax=Sphingosinicella sp. TaxID=1917971 RepID=UPI004037B24E
MDARARLAVNFARLRRETGLSQEKFGLEHNIDRTYVSGIERGTRNPTLEIVQKLADALEVDVVELLAPVGRTR